MNRRTAMASFALALGATAVGVGCGSGHTSAQNNPPATGSADRVAMNPVGSTDREFMTEAAMGGMTEVELGRIAQDKGRSPAVKTFGKKLVDDHSAAGEKLKAIAADVGVTLPSSLDTKHQDMVDKFAKMPAGAKFDNEFMKDAVADHQKDIEDFQKAASNAQNDRVKSFAADTLPTLREHLRMAQSGRHR